MSSPSSPLRKETLFCREQDRGVASKSDIGIEKEGRDRRRGEGTYSY
jgi:hypothetical protein